MDKFTIEAIILEHSQGVFEGSPYGSVVARYNGNLLRFKIDRKRIDTLEEYLDKNVELELEIVKGQNMQAGLKIVGANLV